MPLIILFDGLCNLCQSSVQFILKRDIKKQCYFIPLQSELAQSLIADSEYHIDSTRSIILIESGKWYFRSTAALRIARKLSGAWPLLYLFIMIPAFIRDWIYDWIANNRYRWWGKSKNCWLPTNEWKKRFPENREELKNLITYSRIIS
ncbi:MAG: DUF393 domain-containing protein [Chitinophagia bacterium]|jgi:predicted DCC family thiol-disulfide oxidoreductase YuxK